MSSANTVQEGKWYAIRFASEAMYDKYGWQKDNVVNTKLGDLYDNCLAAANVDTDGSGGETLVMSSMDEITRGQTIRFVSDQIIEDMDQIAFRFVALGDSAYVLQHKSGLYVNGAASGSSLSLGLSPAIFNVSAVGLGKVLIHARNLRGTEYGSNPVYLHAQNAGHSLVTWTATEISSNSALFITEIEEAELSSLDINEIIQEAVKPNSMRIWCYPVGFSVADGVLYEFKGAYQKDDAWHYAFNEVEAAKPGQPVLYVNGDIQSFDKDANDEYETITITSSEIATSPLTENGIYGTYTYQWVNPGAVVVYGGAIASWGNTLVEAMGEENTDCTRDVSANTGYIAPEESIIAEGEYDLVFTIEGEATSLNEELRVKSEKFAAYDLSGRRINSKFKVQNSKLKKGILIVNGKKVLK